MSRKLHVSRCPQGLADGTTPAVGNIPPFIDISRVRAHHGCMTDSPDAILNRILDAAPPKLFLGGEFRDASDGGTFEILDPATDTVLVEVASATEDDSIVSGINYRMDWLQPRLNEPRFSAKCRNNFRNPSNELSSASDYGYVLMGNVQVCLEY